MLVQCRSRLADVVKMLYKFCVCIFPTRLTTPDVAENPDYTPVTHTRRTPHALSDKK